MPRVITPKQQRAIENVVANGGNLKKAMIEAGYSPATAKTPQKLTESDAWQQLMGDRLPDDKLLTKLEEGLDATKVSTSFTEPDQLLPDYAVRHKYLETALKLKKRLGPDAININQFNADSMNVGALIDGYSEHDQTT